MHCFVINLLLNHHCHTGKFGKEKIVVSIPGDNNVFSFLDIDAAVVVEYYIQSIFIHSFHGELISV